MSKNHVTFEIEETHQTVVAHLESNRQSLLDLALFHEIPIHHACGGVCACSTCHVIVEQGGQFCNPAQDEENDQLDSAVGLTPNSRLACQCIPNGEGNLTVRIPAWNRNAIREGQS